MKKLFCCLVIALIICVEAFSESNSIQKGDTGGTVLAIQKILSSLNYLSEEYATGEYEDMTELAVLAFQLDHGIEPTGIADSETQQAITESLKDSISSIPVSNSQSGSNQEGVSSDASSAPESHGETISQTQNNDTIPATGSEISEEGILIDNANIRIAVKSIDCGKDSMEIKLALENKTDIVAMFSVTSATINGWQADPFWADSVPAGKKANAKLKWNSLSKKGITGEPSIVNLAIRVYDSDDWTAPEILQQDFTLYPKGKENAHIDAYEKKSSDVELVDNSNVSIIITGYEIDWIGRYSVNVCLKNKTNKELMFSTEDESINGYACDPFWATELSPNSQVLDSITWAKSSFEENDIDEVKEIELKFRIYDSHDWSAPNILEKAFTINP